MSDEAELPEDAEELSEEQVSDLPVDPGDPMAIQSRTAIRISEEDLELLTYRFPLDMGDEEQIAAVCEELGCDRDALPQDDGVYYFIYVDTPDGRQAVLLPEGDVRGAVLMNALVKGGRPAALAVLFRHGVLPV